MAEYGLQPAGDHGTFFQEFPVPYGELTAMPSLQIVDDTGQPRHEYILRRDYAPVLGGYADGGQAEGPVLWLSDGKRADYAGIDAAGAVVLCRAPAQPNDALRQALEHGALAVLLLRSDPTHFDMRRLVREEALLPQGIPALYVSPRVAQDLLEGSGLTLDDLTIQYTARPLATRVHLTLPLQYQSGATGRSVLGVLPGSDPEAGQQVLVVGGHYDHLGADPDGTLWGGANDNASGVAIVLEIARQWKEQGFVPQRSVLFAAWDGEENGLWGSTYYVQHPRYPLTATVGMLALDMVGEGQDTLFVDQGGSVADQAMAAASQLGVPAQAQSMGRSDHAPFVSANVPATLMIWWDGNAPGVIYHVPADNLHNVNPAKLKAAGQVAELTLLNLSWDQAAVRQAAALLEQAVAARDSSALQRILDPQDGRLATQESAWLDAWRARQGDELSFSLSPALVAGDVATSTLTVRARASADASARSNAIPARWVRRAAQWYYAGPAWETVYGAHARVLHLQQPAEANALVSQADALQQRLGAELGLTAPQTLTVRLYSSDALLQALKPPPATGPASAWPADGTLALSQSAALTATLLQTALQATGWTSTTAAWLAQGLDDLWSAATPELASELEARYLPLLVRGQIEQRLWPADALPAPTGLKPDERELWAAQAWAMTRYLLQSAGAQALRQPSLTGLQGWQSAMLDPWASAAQGIAGTLAQRSQAVLARDEAAFLATVDASDGTLFQEERHWFADLKAHPAATFSLTGTLQALQDGQAIEQLVMKYRLTEEGSSEQSVAWRARFVKRNGRWLYADADWQEQRSPHFVLRYASARQSNLAQDLLAGAERAYAQVTSDLDFHPTQPIELKMYDSVEVFRTSIYLSMIPAHGWTEPGESIKMVDMLADQAARTVAHELSHTALFARGVQHGSLHEGAGQYEAGVFDPLWQTQQIAEWRQQVYDLVRSQRDLDFATLDDWRALAEQDRSLIYNVGWDVVTTFRQRYGRDAFLRWLDLLGSGKPFDDAFLQATGTVYADFDAAWRQDVLRGHIAPQDVETALAFQGQGALQHVQALAQPAWTGREAGTPGNQAAAQYVAQRMAEYGLQAAGDNGTFFQSLVISQTALITTPVLHVLDDSGHTLSTLRYRQDFRELVRGYAGNGSATNEIVYVPGGLPGDMRLGGRVLLTGAVTNPLRAAQAAYEHGASALLLGTDNSEQGIALKSDYLPSLEAHTIPVCLLSKDAFEDLTKQSGFSARQLKGGSPAIPFPLQAQVDVQVTVSPTARIANVLGVLPGSDPALAQEVLVVGAHFDHVGSLPDGTVYPGANDDASGVAVMLEIARLWHERGYRPRRTVLFAAWNAEEKGLLGSAYYVAHPALPLVQTRAMLQLDMVGQGRGYYISLSADEQQDAWILAQVDNAARQIEGRVNVVKYEAGSDHDSFHQRGIPAVWLSWERAEDYHLPTDTADTIDPLKLQATGRLTTLTLMTLADE